MQSSAGVGLDMRLDPLSEIVEMSAGPGKADANRGRISAKMEILGMACTPRLRQR